MEGSLSRSAFGWEIEKTDDAIEVPVCHGCLIFAGLARFAVLQCSGDRAGYCLGQHLGRGSSCPFAVMEPDDAPATVSKS